MRSITVAFFLLALAPAAKAGEAGNAGKVEAPLPEIIVTADWRQDTLMQTPGSLSVITEEVIAARQAQHFEDVINSIPNVNFAAGSNRARYFQIRGIGERSQFVTPLNPSVGFLIDNVDFSGAGTIATLMDVQQVEVLRGPQGTRYGANALAGLINITTKAPSADFSFSNRLSLGQYDSWHYGLVLNGALSARVNGRLAMASHKSDGYISNDFLNRDDTNGRDELSLRARFNFELQDDWTLSLTAARVDIDNGYDAFSLDNIRHTLSDEPGKDAQDSAYLSLNSEWRRPAWRLQMYLNAAESDLNYSYDEDWTYAGFPGGYSQTDQYLRGRDTVSAELRMVSEEAGRLWDRADWVAGIYYLASDERLDRIYTPAAEDFHSDYDFTTTAVFFQVDTDLGERMLLRTGLRFEDRRSRYDDSERLVFRPSSSLWGGRVSLEYLSGGDTLLYGAIAKGYKAGGFNTAGTLPQALRSFAEETLIEYELGLKGRYANERLEVQVALFHDDRRDQQVKISLSLPRSDGSPEFIEYFSNAAEGTNQGLEVSVKWAATDSLDFSLAAGWLDAEFDDFINKDGDDLSGRDQAHAPRYTYSLALNYATGPWFVAVSADGKGAFYFSDSHAEKSSPYTLYNASFGYRVERFGLTLWARNLTDKDYYVRGFSFGNDPRNGYVTEPYYQYGEPRIAGITLEYHLGR